MTAPEGFKWVSCARELEPMTSQARHLIRSGGDTTLCGATASTPDVWRGSSVKPKCVTCAAAVSSSTGGTE